ncbi:hypothetical protein NDU88_002593, partial [Pleurodeles waltl]
VSGHQKKELWCAIAKDLWTLVGLQQAEHPLQETVGGPETLGTEDCRGPTGDGLPTRKGARRNLTPLMACILASQQPQ